MVLHYAILAFVIISVVVLIIASPNLEDEEGR